MATPRRRLICFFMMLLPVVLYLPISPMSRLVMRARVNSWLIMHSVRGAPAVPYLCMSAWLPTGKRVNSWLIMHSVPRQPAVSYLSMSAWLPASKRVNNWLRRSQHGASAQVVYSSVHTSASCY